MEFLSSLINLDPQVLIQGGLIVAVIGLLWLNSSSNKLYFNHTNEVIDRNSEAITSHAVTNQKLSDSIDELIRHLNK